MSILNSASSRSVYRGYDYYKEGNVISHTQLSDFEYEGEVQGTNKIPYNELISELKSSEYAKRTALFDEIDKAITNK